MDRPSFCIGPLLGGLDRPPKTGAARCRLSANHANRPQSTPEGGKKGAKSEVGGYALPKKKSRKPLRINGLKVGVTRFELATF